MIDAPRLLKTLQAQLRRLEDDLREQIDAHPELDDSLKAEHAAAREAGRTAQTYSAWREEPITQAAVAWILGAVFVRFLEDNHFLDHPWLSGSGEHRRRADDEYRLYFRTHPEHSDRDYLLHVFSQVEQLPAGAELFDRRHNPLWRFPISGDAARELRELFREIAPDSGQLVHDFEDEDGDTRFLGDLYQDLSEPARKRYALLQTPEFVESFILDRTLTPAIQKFGWREVRLIDPTCGSGHFLLGAFHRLLELRRRHEPGVPEGELAQRALDGVYGVDVNPFAVRIARFRLLVAALLGCGIPRLADAPAFRINVAAGDSLLHGRRFRSIAGVQRGLLEEDDPLRHVFETEDVDELARILGQQYHAVAGNPPYITPKDKALNAAYRARYSTCYRQYSLVVPFLERFFDLAIEGSRRNPAGYIGLIVANSFMKREFGKKLVGEHLSYLDLTYVIDASGAYIPGHGTPTIILFGRHKRPVKSTIRAVLGIRGEPEIPLDPAHGLVWSAILDQVDQPGSESDYVSVGDFDRKRFGQHPWSLQGGGAAELKARIDSNSTKTLARVAEEIGFGGVTREDDAYLVTSRVALRVQIPKQQIRPLVAGEVVRDWTIRNPTGAIWPYHPETLDVEGDYHLRRFLWLFREQLSGRVAYGKSQLQRGLAWFEYSMFFRKRFRTPLSITFAFVATHNHFVLDRGGKVFNRSAPIIKLPPDTPENEHLELLGLLNSSVACFWMKQMFQPKSGSGIGRGIQPEDWMERYEHDGTKLQRFPVCQNTSISLVQFLDTLSHRVTACAPSTILEESDELTRLPLAIHSTRTQATSLRQRMIGLQEDLDWQCYHLYDLLPDDIRLDPDDTPEVTLGERAFEIVLARRMAKGETKTTWFERHGSTPITEIPDHWPAPYKEIVARRIELIETDKSIRLLERPEYKRRWNDTPWEEKEQTALRSWLLDRLETFWPRNDPAPELRSTAHLADEARSDDAFRAVAAIYTGREDVDFAKLIRQLVLGEAVPFLPSQRYKPAGQRKRREWENTWDLQRQEDAIDALTELPEDAPRHITPDEADRRKREEVGDIPVPPKYRSADFAKPTYWKLRGKLDVPKERFVLYPGTERDGDPSPVICWAGWNHLQQAQALATYYLARKDEGWSRERLLPLLAGILELRPWLLQWHNELDPRFGIGLGTYYADFLAEELRALEATERGALGVMLRQPGRATLEPSADGRTEHQESRYNVATIDHDDAPI